METVIFPVYFRGEYLKKRVPVGFRLLDSGVEVQPGDLVCFESSYHDYPAYTKIELMPDAWKEWAYTRTGYVIGEDDAFRLIRPAQPETEACKSPGCRRRNKDTGRPCWWCGVE
jgi:hypothetical protein